MPRFAAKLLQGLALAAIFGATLYPSGGETQAPLVLCIVCGEQGVSDALTNLILFMPLGAALALGGWRGAAITLAATLLSTGIEGAQLLIPGRDPSLGDILFNGLGGTVGGAVIAAGPWWIAPTPRRAKTLLLAATAVAASILVLGGWLLQPAFPASAYYGQWTPNLGHIEWYRGRVLEAAIADVPLPPHLLPDGSAVRRLLLEGAPLHVRAIAGSWTGGVGSLFSIYDEHQREILLLGPDRDDFVLRYRRRAADFGLDAPDLRLLGATRALHSGDSVTVTARRGWCLAVNARQACGLGDPPGRAWSVLLYPESFPPWLRRLLDAGWLAGLWLAFGLWGRRAGYGFTVPVASGLGLVCALAPQALGQLPISWLETAGAGAGILAGRLVGRTLAALHRTRGPA